MASDVLREVVKSPWFEWRLNMMYDFGDWLSRQVNESCMYRGVSRRAQVFDCDANVGPLLSMLRDAVGDGACIGITPQADGSIALSAYGRHDVDGVGSTLCQALCAALLALPEKP